MVVAVKYTFNELIGIAPTQEELLAYVRDGEITPNMASRYLRYQSEARPEGQKYTLRELVESGIDKDTLLGLVADKAVGPVVAKRYLSYLDSQS
jgi:hypothetical protein